MKIYEAFYWQSDPKHISHLICVPADIINADIISPTSSQGKSVCMCVCVCVRERKTVPRVISSRYQPLLIMAALHMTKSFITRITNLKQITTDTHTHTHTHTRNDLLTHTPAVLLRRLWIFREGQISWGVNQWMNQSLPSWSLWCLVIKLTLFSTRSQLLPNLWIFDAHLPA